VLFAQEPQSQRERALFGHQGEDQRAHIASSCNAQAIAEFGPRAVSLPAVFPKVAELALDPSLQVREVRTRNWRGLAPCSCGANAVAPRLPPSVCALCTSTSGRICCPCCKPSVCAARSWRLSCRGSAPSKWCELLLLVWRSPAVSPGRLVLRSPRPSGSHWRRQPSRSLSPRCSWELPNA
jgi:hypothetical protein